MNKLECKRYIKIAYKNLINYNRNISISNIESEMKKVISEQMEEYIAYTKIAVRNMKNSGNLEISLKDILEEIDILLKIYTKDYAINEAKKL